MNKNYLKVAAVVVLPLMPQATRADTIVNDYSVHYNNNSTNYNDNRRSGGDVYGQRGVSVSYINEHPTDGYYANRVIVAVPRYRPAPMFRIGPVFRPQFGFRPMYRPY